MKLLAIAFVILLWFSFIGFWQAAIIQIGVGVLMFRLDERRRT